MISTTEKKILEAALLLFSQRGYDAVATKEIAHQAGVSEMTLFRHFACKRNLFESMFETYIFTPQFKVLFEQQMEENLERDLIKICHCYQENLWKNQKIIMMQFRNQDFMSISDAPLLRFPSELKRLLLDYLSKMKEKGYFIADAEKWAVNILAYNFGLFMLCLVNKQLLSGTEIDNYIADYAQQLSVRSQCPIASGSRTTMEEN
ncbi:TetR/AcrR family transcriptional regulator [Desulfitobacterium metallireducens]|uniref:TetR family transcriptional regulator n=1 Tax=Desulfitobacterium metallireducens DSM 15288 TaxID=871968 RepID=W0EAC2_9FIRM|nr:TetR/AcrR family transcriptional regulator [Desulfitobacterium metallireducens]AHF07687.1 TetR family transcriptional regulator [Desulfitobacterium metallireducens DSM 15288]